MTTIPPTPPADAEVAEPATAAVVALLELRDRRIREARTENARLRERAAAADERYTRLVGEVERIAENNEAAAAAHDHVPGEAAELCARVHRANARGLRSAVAATAPQTAPAQPRAWVSVPGHDGRCDRDVELGLHRPMPTASEPTAADPEPVRVTAGTEATAIVRKHLDPLVGPAGIGSTYTFHAGLPEVLTGRIVTDLLTAGLLDAAHPAGDEHLQALRSVEQLLWPRGGARRVPHQYARELPQAVEWLLEQRVTLTRGLDQAEHERAEARREAERLRDELDRLLNPTAGSTITVVEHGGTITLPDYLAGSSDTTGDTP